ncbi:MAG TPA: hypothetical protein VGI39_05375 [Polyangiaceae bacterium]|jgi:hypothetical protein
MTTAPAVFHVEPMKLAGRLGTAAIAAVSASVFLRRLLRADVGLALAVSIAGCARAPMRMSAEDAPPSASPAGSPSGAAPEVASRSVVAGQDPSDRGDVRNGTVCASPFAPFFPPNDSATETIDPKTMLASGDWWKEYVFRSVRASSEPPLWNCGKQVGPDTVRVFDPWGGLAYPMVKRIERTDEHVLVHIGSTREGLEQTSTLAAGTWTTIAQCLDRTTLPATAYDPFTGKILNMAISGG